MSACPVPRIARKQPDLLVQLGTSSTRQAVEENLDDQVSDIKMEEIRQADLFQFLSSYTTKDKPV